MQSMHNTKIDHHKMEVTNSDMLVWDKIYNIKERYESILPVSR